jgi:hypothetical protein
MNERLCNLFEECESPEAPLCPIQESTVKRGIWYPDEPICQAKLFQEISWLKKQHQIAALRLKTDAGFFTIRMLDAIHVVTKNLRGADPDNSDAESKWLEERLEKRTSVTEKKRSLKNSRTTTKRNLAAAIPLFESSRGSLHSTHNNIKSEGRDGKEKKNPDTSIQKPRRHQGKLVMAKEKGQLNKREKIEATKDKSRNDKKGKPTTIKNRLVSPRQVTVTRSRKSS